MILSHNWKRITANVEILSSSFILLFLPVPSFLFFFPIFFFQPLPFFLTLSFPSYISFSSFLSQQYEGSPSHAADSALSDTGTAQMKGSCIFTISMISITQTSHRAEHRNLSGRSCGCLTPTAEQDALVWRISVPNTAHG